MLRVRDNHFWDMLKMENTLPEDLEDAWDHGMLVSSLAGMIARQLGQSEEFCREIELAGMVHDVGKLQVGEYLYGRQEGTLAIEEMQYVRLHPVLGFERLKQIGGFSDKVLEAVYYHHENYDGSGYPSNLRGERIPFAARILRVCDVYVALTSERPYRAAFDLETAVELMIDEVKNFDMQIFLALLAVVHSEEMREMQEFTKRSNQKIKARNIKETIKMEAIL